ncbi:TetR/AcrR family transcriptional regulator [Cellulomonas carbonis]|uniref:TetR family transcriptional regulator n=1 Tax=Cellulomonas carbonis T26 TaxID=947969 RepID=A0A0A0BV79_9CELL|nr:TetR family transcriptional regulator [Cellulomonas carbonis]KGM11885.1 TetR family transcriptional regulator [Cellulomonas carbonis T26]GGB91473.1 TetR family transcriptional regulator [Cellulomonas carbonis]
MGTRRHDPDRRSRIIDAALDVIAEVGVAGASHRAIADRADVPLGSMTYHFNGMDDLLREAFMRFAATGIARFETALRAATGRDQARAAVVDLIHGDTSTANRDLILTFELYTLAARKPAFRDITRNWMAASRHELERHFTPDEARRVDALIEGLSIHRALDLEPPDRHFTEDTMSLTLTD